jgi:putative hydrolase of the HAD superfamily
MIKAIFFDLGDVVVLNSTKEFFQELAKNLKIDFEELMKLREEFTFNLCLGKISVNSFGKIIKDRFKLPAEPDKIISIWIASYKKIVKPNVRLLKTIRELKKDYVVGLISNIYDLTVKMEKERGIFEYFNPYILSCEVGLAKPQKEIFELALQKADLKGEECIFIDNREKHLMTAEGLGFKTILFKNNQQFVKGLKTFGLEI